MVKINFVVLGAQKSASTFLQSLISDHPDIYMPTGETPYFQDPDYHSSSLDNHINLSNVNTVRVVGIKRPNYIGPSGKFVPERIYRHNSNCILIAVLRNPIDRFVSHFYHQVRYAGAPNMDINEILPKILKSDTSLLKEYPRLNEVPENGLYAKYLKPYYSLFPPENIIVFTQEELIDNPRKIIRQIYFSLGVDENHIPSDKYFAKRPQSVDYRAKSLFFWRIISSLTYRYSDDKTRMYPAHNLTMLRKILVLFVKLFRLTLDRLTLLGPNRSPTLTRESVNLLSQYYIDDILATEDLIGKNLSAWRAI